MAYSQAQQWALVLAPKITGLISFLFSGLVIFTVVICKEKRSKTYHRLLLGISCVDASSSFWLGLSTWPIPKDTGILWAFGNTTSCTLQGFWTQFGITSSWYNASLSVFYLLVIRYGWKEDRIIRVEPWLHAVPLLWGFGTAIAGLPLTIFNSANLWCWIAPYGDRGADADLYRWVFFYCPLWIMITLVTINVILIFQHVRLLEQASGRYRMEASFQSSGPLGPSDYQLDYSSNVGGNQRGDLQGELEDDTAHEEVKGDREGAPEESKEEIQEIPEIPVFASTLAISTRKSGFVSTFSLREKKKKKKRTGRTREVANQSLRYAGSFYFTWTALTLTRLLQAVNGKTYFPLLIIAATTTPLQGLPNFLVYLHPRYKKMKKEYPDAGRWAWLKGSISPDHSRARSMAAYTGASGNGRSTQGASVLNGRSTQN